MQFLPEKLSLKSAKELYEYCQKAEQDYRHLISGRYTGSRHLVVGTLGPSILCLVDTTESRHLVSGR